LPDASRTHDYSSSPFDRLSRDVRIAENLFHEFGQLGVEILIADMPTYNANDRKDVISNGC